MDQPEVQPKPFEVAESALAPKPAEQEKSAKPAPPRDEGGAHVKETLESIVVAFILAFIFRCFIVEAFVIPTGSMAPTLMGAHTRHQCPDCGYRFDVNFSAHGGGGNEEDLDIPSHAGPEPVEERDPDHPGQTRIRLANVNYTDLHCPNCGYLLPREANPPVYYGDRILVLKYVYLLHGPRRWDVVVFKAPDDPQSKEYAVNYIKRLTGLPGETVMILDGDIYVKPKGGKEFILQRKTASAQEALWRIIYDDDYRPSGAQRTTPWRQPWEQVEGSGWTDRLASGERGMAFDGESGTGTLSFNPHLEREGAREPENYGFRDWLAYDQHHPNHPNEQPPAWEGQYPVSDLKLSMYYARSAGEGPLRLTLTKQDHAFTAEFLPDKVILHHLKDGKPAAQDRVAPLPPRTAKEPMKIDFTNVDYRVTVKIDGKDVMATTDEEYHPELADLRKRVEDYESRLDAGWMAPSRNPSESPLPPPTVAIRAEKQKCELSHVSLWRDTYYTQRDAWKRPIKWASPRERPFGEGGPIELGDDEYFVMGDNSPSSSDARYWEHGVHLAQEELDVKPGRVPGRFLLGRAFFVYWPAGFRPTDKMPGMVPNFGEMRFIR
jgi:signal peptidase I